MIKDILFNIVLRLSLQFVLYSILILSLHTCLILIVISWYCDMLSEVLISDKLTY